MKPDKYKNQRAIRYCILYSKYSTNGENNGPSTCIDL